ncbi:MAG TPA: replicative DNA helicase [Desulfobacterales bacterium]|nr:replicative DNA helicase [Desulfobacterales bacterium]
MTKDPSLYNLPPQSIEAEESVLSAIMVRNEMYLDVIDILTASDFYRSAHQKIYSAMVKLFLNKEPIDLTTLTHILRKQGQFEKIGGAVYLAKLINEVPLAVNAPHYAQIVREKACLRKLIEKGSTIINRCFEDSDNAAIILDDAQREITSIHIGGQNETFTSMEKLTCQTYEYLETLNSGKAPKGIKTGFWELDMLTGGLIGSKLIILGARPRIGKTSMMLNIVANMAKNGHKVGIFSIEMDQEELDISLLSAESGINSMRLRFGTGPDKYDWEKIVRASEQKSKWPIIIDDTGALSIMELCRRARKMKRDGCEVIFIDQFSKIKGDRGKNKFEEATAIVERLGDLKKELRIPVVLLAQINRKLEDRGNKKPTLADFKNTGQLEEEADIALLLHREEEYYPSPENKGEGNLEIAKHRGGPCRDIHLRWDAKRTKFTSAEPEPNQW